MNSQLVNFHPHCLYIPVFTQPIIQTRIKRVFSIPTDLIQDIKHKQIAQKLDALESSLKSLVQKEKSHQKTESLCEIKKQEVSTLMGIQNIIFNPQINYEEIPKLRVLLKQLNHQFKLEGKDKDPLYLELIQKGQKFIVNKYLEDRKLKKVSGLSNSVSLNPNKEDKPESSDRTNISQLESLTIQNSKTPLKRPQSIVLNNNSTRKKSLQHSYSATSDLRLSFYRALNQQCKKLEDKLQVTIDNTIRQQTKLNTPNENIQNSFAQFQQSVIKGQVQNNHENSRASSDMPYIDFFRREQQKKSTYLNKTFAERTQVDIQIRQSRLESYQTFIKSQKIKNQRNYNQKGSFCTVDLTLKKRKNFQRNSQLDLKFSNSPAQKRKISAAEIITINLKPRHHKKQEKNQQSVQLDKNNSDRYIQIGKIEKILQDKLKNKIQCDPKIIEMKKKIAKLLFPLDPNPSQKQSLCSENSKQ